MSAASPPEALTSAPPKQSLRPSDSAADRLEAWLKEQSVKLQGLTVTSAPGSVFTDLFTEREFTAEEVRRRRSAFLRVCTDTVRQPWT